MFFQSECDFSRPYGPKAKGETPCRDFTVRQKKKPSPEGCGDIFPILHLFAGKRISGNTSSQIPKND